MINLETGEMRVNDITDQIKSWTVWFSTFEGLFPTLEEARQSCDRTGQPMFTIKPLPVALGSGAGANGPLYEPIVG